MSLSLALLHSAGFTHNDLKKIFADHEEYDRVLDIVSSTTRLPTPWMTDNRYAKIVENLEKLNSKRLENIFKEKDIEIVTIHSEKYPEKLRTIKQAPYLLYVRGELREERRMIGVVGSRRNTNYGQKILEKIIPDIVSAGCGIVSGWAYGIDSIAHQIALDISGYTISVFGFGVDIFYPSTNTKLFERILSSGGALISQFPIGTIAEPYNFPIRNEVVAALSDGIIIPEAGVKSGTLITAGLALEHGRDVFAVPGDIFRETSQGTNQLIARWEAKCIHTATDILEEYFPNISSAPISLFWEKTFESEEQKDIYCAIEEWYNTPDSIWENRDYTIDTIIMTLSLLEMNGYIRLWAWGKYEIV